MEIIVFILIVIFALATSGKNKKNGNAAAGNKAANARRQAPAAQKGAVQTARPVRPAKGPKPVAPASALPKDINGLKAALNRLAEEAQSFAEPVVQPVSQTAQGASMLADADCAGGSMPHTHAEGHSGLEDEDCAGGSMAHTHSEGVSRSAHARRMAAIDANRSEEADILQETIDARALRRAVVMAEVLGKPKALKRF